MAVIDVKQQTSVALYYLHQVAEIMRTQGCSIERWLAAEDLCEADLMRNDCKISLAAYQRLILSAVTQSRLPHLGLLLGAQLSINHHGALGFALLNCGNVAQILSLFERYLITRTPLFSVEVKRESETTQIRLHSMLIDEQILRPLTEVLVATLTSIINGVAFNRESAMAQQLDCRDRVITCIDFSYSPPNYATRYEALLQQKCVFVQPYTCIHLANHWLNKPLRHIDPQSLQQAKEFCERERINALVHINWQTKVLIQVIATSAQYPDLNAIAAKLNVTPRTLHRHLLREGTSFKQIVEHAFCSLAQQYLQQHSSTIKQVAYQLGYSDVANFRRAFKRWTGQTPQQFLQHL
ncbi:AraC family transcriptional regulator [Alteromonas flava]|uniref:AraC family transcriptional regulator n=1 Tax=Alteromonas flava TaxID=2048003 RepID=UPI0013DAC133|nr:AraC family transcriptional regulator [Alteromonas flava]